MKTPLDVSLAPMIQPIAGPAAELDRLGDEMVIIRARLEPEAGAVVVQALAAAREALHQRARATDAVGGSAGPRFTDGPAGPGYVDGSPEAPTIEQQEADALALVAETALHRGIDPGTPGERYQVVVH